ncbi:MAG: 4Fe-4S binding protein [Methanocella sp.]|jgi:Fe-S-cluster-containing hydrogenase component 2
MITHYGYIDGSGEFYIIVDSDRCSGCGECVQACPQNALTLITEFIDLEDKTVAAITEEHRKKIKYTCAACKPENKQTPCIKACKTEALSCVWKPL